MKWNPAHIDPIIQGTYLCFGDRYTPHNEEKGVYYLAQFIFGPSFEKHEARWIEDVPDYNDMILKYWCELPESPNFNQPERSKREDRYIGGYFPPPWDPYEHPEKTEGWLAFQEEQRKDPDYYGCGALNSMET